MKILVLFLLVGSCFAATDCQTTVKAKTQSQINVCITQNGNVVRLEGPPQWPQINGVEGYAICTDSEYFDLGTFDSGNWSPTIITQPKGPNTFPLTMLRETADGKYFLNQIFTLINAGKTLSVTMQVSGNNIGSLVRYVEPSAQTGGNTQSSAFAWSTSGLLLSPKSPVPNITAKSISKTTNPCQEGSGGLALTLTYPLNGKWIFNYSVLR